MNRDFSNGQRWRRAAEISRGLGRAYLVGVQQQEGGIWDYEAAGSERQARRWARERLSVRLHWRKQEGALVGYYLRENERQRHPRLFEAS